MMIAQVFGRTGMSETTGVSIERTLVLLKPDAVTRGVLGRIVARFEDALFKVVGVKMVWMDADLTRRHYVDLEERQGTDVYNVTASYMQQGPVLALVLEGVDTIKAVRKMLGPTIFPGDSPPGTIRGDFGHQTKAYANTRGRAVANLVHASGSAEDAKREVELWFKADELFDYEILAEKYAF
jgi:nucleoside-diphosphate kinase